MPSVLILQWHFGLRGGGAGGRGEGGDILVHEETGDFTDAYVMYVQS